MSTYRVLETGAYSDFLWPKRVFLYNPFIGEQGRVLFIAFLEAFFFLKIEVMTLLHPRLSIFCLVVRSLRWRTVWWGMMVMPCGMLLFLDQQMTRSWRIFLRSSLFCMGWRLGEEQKTSCFG